MVCEVQLNLKVGTPGWLNMHVCLVGYLWFDTRSLCHAVLREREAQNPQVLLDSEV